MENIEKLIYKQDAYYKLNSGHSGETSINLNYDLAIYLGFENGDITFTLHKEDFIKAICNIMALCPLYTTTSKDCKKIDYSVDLFNKNIEAVESYFGNENVKDYKVSLLIREDGRYYLNQLKVSGFNARSFLVEKHSKLSFHKTEEEKKFDLRIDSFIAEILSEEQAEPIAKNNKEPDKFGSLQQIFYGAPGTGKSHAIKEIVKSCSHVRTTFHPDSDYSSFVGAYKPTMKGTGVIHKVGDKQVEDEKITYSFVPQAFLKAYIAAWKNYPKHQFLVIEEINRGNCAQIFGDLFQLLDRNEYGFSDYPINSDIDLCKYIREQFDTIELEDKDEEYINSIYSDEHDDMLHQVMCGEVLLLPSNLHIWATMNTSDQSLFPIDSAFKRRWDWKYTPIAKPKNEDWLIRVHNTDYSWWSFLEKINEVIQSTTDSEDKQLGYFFAKAKNDIISAEMLVNKVLFYLWNDVFKDYGFDSPIFTDKDDNGKLSFQKFFDCKGEANENKVQIFLDNLKAVKIIDKIVQDDNEDETWNDKFSINGEGSYGKGSLAKRLLEMYIEAHSDMTVDKVLNDWNSLNVKISNFIEDENHYNERISKAKDNRTKPKEVVWQNGHIYITTEWIPETTNQLIEAINAKDWGLHVEKL